MERTSWTRRKRTGAVVLAAIAQVSLLLIPGPAIAATPAKEEVSATLDGRPLKLTSVADWYCDDFSYPTITCFSDRHRLDARDAGIFAASSVVYVTIYDFTSYTGSFMHVSQDYTVLASFGWNDRVSSFIAHNSLDGHFFTDWFYSGTGYYFCCNQNAPSLGSFDNTFSSVHQG